MQIYVAEDDQDDQLLIKDAFLENQVEAEFITFVENGEDLFDLLTTTVQLPSLILLDLNMPKMDGRQTLVKLKADPKLKHIPTLMLTTSLSENDIMDSYREGSNSYFVKPPLFSELVELLGIVKKYWFEKALLVK